MINQHAGIGMTSQRTRDRLIDRLREQGIHDMRVLSVIRQIPRHLFIEEALAHLDGLPETDAELLRRLRFADGIVRQASRALGSALMLPSFVLHRVAPVTRGERYSLTLWSHGPAFR